MIPLSIFRRRIAGSPDRRIAGSPDRRIAGLVMSPSVEPRAGPLSRDGPARPAAPPVPPRAADRRRTGAARPRRRLRLLLPALLCLPLLSGLSTEAAAQTPTISVEMATTQGLESGPGRGVREAYLSVQTRRHAPRGTPGYRATYKLCFSGTATYNVDYRVSVFRHSLQEDIPLGNNTCDTAALDSHSFYLIYKISVAHDRVQEADETVIATLSEVTGATIRTRSRTYTIVDDDRPLVATVSAPSRATESTTIPCTVTLNKAPAANIPVNLTITQTGNVLDSGQGGDKQITIMKGETTATRAIALRNNNKDDPAGTPLGSVTCTLKSTKDYGVGSPAAVTTAVYNFAPPLATVSAPSRTTEHPTFPCTVTLAQAVLVDLRVNLTITQTGNVLGSGQGGNKQLTIRKGQTTATRAISPRNNSDTPGLKPLGSVTCTLKSGDNYRVGSTAAVTTTVYDRKPTTVNIVIDNNGWDVQRRVIAPMVEGAAMLFTMQLSRTLVAGEIIDVPLRISGTGVTTNDWRLAFWNTHISVRNTGITLLRARTAQPIVRFSGAGTDRAALALTTVADNVAEPGGETFTVALGTKAEFDASNLGTNVRGGAGPKSAASSITRKVIDAGGPTTVTWTRVAYSVVESNGPVEPLLVLSPAPDMDIPLKIILTPGTATRGADFLDAAVLNHTHSTNRVTEGVRVSIRTDTVDEPTETFTLTIDAASLPAGITPGPYLATTITIFDDDPTVVSLARVGTGAIEEGKTLTFTVTLSRALVAGETIDVPLSIGGTTVTTNDHWRLALKRGQGLNTGVALSGARTVTPNVRFSGAGAEVATLEWTTTVDSRAERGGTTIRIALGPDGTGPNGFDRPGLDTTVQSQSFGGVNPHATHHEIAAVVYDVGGTPIEVASFASATSRANEDDGRATMRVDLRPPPRVALTLSYTVSGTATAGSDYTALPGTVAVTANALHAFIPVVIRDDNANEPPETVILTLIDGSGYTVGSASTHTLTIADNDGGTGTNNTGGTGGTGTNNNTGGTPPPPPPPPTVRLTVSPNPVSEGQAVTVTLTLSRVLSNPVTIPLTLTAGTADAGDYGTLPSVTIPAGAVTGTGTLSTLADTDTDDETVTVAFGTLPSTVTAGTPATVLLTLTDTSPTELDRLKEAIRRTLSAIGRRALTGALDQLGARLAEPGTGATLTLNGHTIALGPAGASPLLASLVPAAPACGMGHARDAGAPRCPAGAGPPTSPLSLAALLQASAFTLPLQAATKAGLSPTGPRWALWGRGDVGTFKGRPDAGTAYTGRARTGWLGLDARHGPWVAGLAVSHGTGTADYALVAGTPGRLETSVTTVHPYGRWTVADGLDLRVVLGAGAGRARHDPGTGPRTSAPLTLWLGSLGIRQVLPSVAGFTAAVRADASLTRIAFGAGPGFVTDVSADSWRGRAGVEVARTLALAPDTAVAPFVEAAVRRDGGDGIRGTGLEVAGGVRYTAPRVQVEARGRVLAAYTQGGTHEQGVSVTARVGPGAQGRGWSLALLPRWGAAPTGAQALWAADLPTHAATAPAPAALEAQVGYGVGLATLGLLTPFAEAGLTGETARHLRLGARLAAPRVNLMMTLAGEQRTQAGTHPVQALRLDLQWQF